MMRFCNLAVLLIAIHAAHSSPQFFGQSFSSSSFTGPNGQVITQSAYQDTNGNRVVNGQQAPVRVVPAPAAVRPAPAAPRPPSSSGSKVNSGQYVHDNSGAYKGN